VETVDSAAASSSSVEVASSNSVDIPTTSSSEPASLVKSTLDLLVGGFGLLTDYYDLTIVKCVSLCRFLAQAGWHLPPRQLPGLRPVLTHLRSLVRAPLEREYPVANCALPRASDNPY
jgi:hypothetical protein